MSAVALAPKSASWARLAAFAGMSGLAAWRYAGVETRPPTARVLAVAAIAVVAGASLILIPVRVESPRTARTRAAAVRAIVILAAATGVLLAAGVPFPLLPPTAWGRLAHGLHGGLETVATTLWPYAGSDPWTRLDILLALALVPVAAAALAFWPAGDGNPHAALRHALRQLAALALLLTLYVIGVLDSNGGSATVDGLLVLVLMVGWLWLPGLRARRVVAALAWLASAGVVAAVLVGQLAGRQAWFDYRAWDVLGVGPGTTAFSWDQTYGPIPWSRSQRTMFTVHTRGPLLWKVTTLDRFDGLRFVRSGTDPATEADLPLPLNDRWYSFATFTIAGLHSGLLPTQQGTTAAVNSGDPIRYEQDGTVLSVGRALRSGDAYTVMSYVPTPTPAELRAAPHAFPAGYLRYTNFDLPSPSQSGLRIGATDPPHPGQFFTARTVGSQAPGVPLLRHLRSSSEFWPLPTGRCTGSRAGSPPGYIRPTTSCWRSRPT